MGSFATVNVNGVLNGFATGDSLSTSNGSIEIVGPAPSGPIAWSGGGLNGNWSNVANWTGGTAPNGIAAGALINLPPPAK